MGWGQAEGGGGEQALVDQLVDVGVGQLGDERIGVAEPVGDGRHRDVLGDQPDRVGVAQVVEVQPAVAGPGVLEPGSGEGGFPDAGEVVGGQGGPAAAPAGWGGEDQVEGLRVVGEALPVVAEGVGGGLVEGDGALGGRGGGGLVAPSAAAAGVGEHAADAQAAGADDGAVVERVAQVEVVPAQRGEFLEAQAGVGGDDDQGVVVGMDGVGELGDLLGGEPDLPLVDRLRLEGARRWVPLGVRMGEWASRPSATAVLRMVPSSER